MRSLEQCLSDNGVNKKERALIMQDLSGRLPEGFADTPTAETQAALSQYMAERATKIKGDIAEITKQLGVPYAESDGGSIEKGRKEKPLRRRGGGGYSGQ